MRTLTVTCDFCQHVIDPSNKRELVVHGQVRDACAVCLEAAAEDLDDPKRCEASRKRVLDRRDDAALLELVAEVIAAP